MKKINFILCCLFLFQVSKAQFPLMGCDQSTTVVNSIYSSNSITTITTSPAPAMFLCGPNTVVYDTLNAVSNNGLVCRQVFISPSSTLVTNAPACLYYVVYFVKNNGTIIFTSKTNAVGVYVHYEPGATIINNSSGVISTFSCSPLLFPTVNCTTTGINENAVSKNNFLVYPNPATDVLDLKLQHENSLCVAVFEIMNSMGQKIQQEEIIFKEGGASINTTHLANGVYILNLRTTNAIGINKRFVISH